jgi:hypothetical protein
LTRTMPVPLGKIPEKQLLPQDASARQAKATAPLRNVTGVLRGKDRMGFTPECVTQPCADGDSGWDSMPVRGLAQEGRFYFSRNAAHGNGTFRVFYVETRKSDRVPPVP